MLKRTDSSAFRSRVCLFFNEKSVVKYFEIFFNMDLSYLLSLFFVSLSIVFVHPLFSCFDLLFLLVLEFMLSSRIYLLPYQECYSLGIVRCQFFTGGRVSGVRADLGSLVLVSCDCAQANLFLNNSKPVAMLAIRYSILKVFRSANPNMSSFGYKNRHYT